MAFRVGLLGKMLLVVVVLVVVLVAWIGWLLWKRPLTVDAQISRFALAKAGLVETKVEASSGPMTVFEGGQGEQTMVLLHGAGDQAGAWARSVPSLLGAYRVLAPDLPGHWQSPPLEGPLHIRVVLQGLEALVEARSADQPVVLVGNSMGGWVAMLYAHQHPDRVERVVAVNGGAITVPDPQVNLFPSNRDEARATMAGLMGPATPPIPGFVLDDIVRRSRTNAAARLAQTAAELTDWVLDGRLHEIEVPVDLVWGDADQLMTLDYAGRLIDGLARARLYKVAACGHVPHRECPDRFVEALEKALSTPYDEVGPALDDGVEIASSVTAAAESSGPAAKAAGETG